MQRRLTRTRSFVFFFALIIQSYTKDSSVHRAKKKANKRQTIITTRANFSFIFYSLQIAAPFSLPKAYNKLRFKLGSMVLFSLLYTIFCLYHHHIRGGTFEHTKFREGSTKEANPKGYVGTQRPHTPLSQGRRRILARCCSCSCEATQAKHD